MYNSDCSEAIAILTHFLIVVIRIWVRALRKERTVVQCFVVCDRSR